MAVKKIMGVAAIFTVLIFGACGKQAAGTRNVVIYANHPSSGSETDSETESAAEEIVEDIVLENQFLELRFLPQTAEIVLTDKASGVQWRSNPFDYANDPLKDPVTEYLLESQFSLKYADVSGIGMTLYSGEQSVKPGAYSYSLVSDSAGGDSAGVVGGLEVNYTVGNLIRTYVIPPAAAEDRIQPFLDKMAPDEKSKFNAIYRLYDINNLRSNDNREELLSKYPDLSRRKIYAMRENSQEYLKEQCEEYFAAAGYTYDDYIEDSARYPSSGGSEKPAFNITMHYALEGKSLVVSVPFDRMAYRPAYHLTQLTILPYMGAGGINDEGYLLVPDGSGALIYFNNGRQNQIIYNNFVYGWDEAMPRAAVINDDNAPFPVFGIQKNGSALLCVIEEGASYASVQADVSGRNSSWNNIYACFDMVHKAPMEFAARSQQEVYNYEKSLPAGEKIVLRYTPCASDGYVGMAKEYRSWLMHKYPSLNMRTEDGVPIAIEIPGAVNKTQHRLGIPFDLPLKLTSYAQAEGMINDFADFGWKNVRIKLNGWFNRSVDHSVPTKIKLIRPLGAQKDFQKLIAAAEKNGYEVYPEADFLFMKDTKPFDGFSLYRDAARYVSRKRIEKYPYSFVWFGERIRWGKLSYLARPAYMMSLIDNFMKKSAKLNLNNIAFRSIGARLAGDYNERRHISREASMRLQQEKLARLHSAGTGVLLNTGYAYAAPWADFITDIALGDQRFGITDCPVPFYPMALHGLVPYTGRAINLAEDYTKNLLKTVESGAGLYFSFMAEETAELQETKFRQFYANEYDKWVADADKLYRQFSADFAGLYRQAIVDHVILANEVTLTEYEDGTKVIVNSGGIDWNYNGTIIKADNYVVIRGDE